MILPERWLLSVAAYVDWELCLALPFRTDSTDCLLVAAVVVVAVAAAPPRCQARYLLLAVSDPYIVKTAAQFAATAELVPVVSYAILSKRRHSFHRLRFLRALPPMVPTGRGLTAESVIDRH